MARIQSVQFPDVLLIQRDIYFDERGCFRELYCKAPDAELGIEVAFVQDNLSSSKKGVIRGMHFQTEPGQAKLVTCLVGEIFDVFVDIRADSPQFGKWGSYRLKGESGDQLFIPAGFAHGFASLADGSQVLYKVSSLYNPETERGFRYDDPAVGIEWPIENPTLSKRDRQACHLKEILI